MVIKQSLPLIPLTPLKTHPSHPHTLLLPSSTQSRTRRHTMIVEKQTQFTRSPPHSMALQYKQKKQLLHFVRQQTIVKCNTKT